MFTLPFLLSIIPFFLFLYLLLVKKISLFKTSFLTLFLVGILVYFFWRIIPSFMLVSFEKGFFIALDIFFIILGAIFFLEILRDLKILDNISHYLETFSKDYRIQVILLAWFLENFLEGTAGFGTPSTVVAPLLVGLGFTPLTAVIIAMLGNSSSAVFGAAGTPIRIGFAGLDVSQIPLLSSYINCVGLLVPVFILWVMTRRRKKANVEFWEALPFAIWSGVAFVVPSILVVSLGQEFPSILGSIIGLILVLVSLRLGIFVPKQIRSFRSEKIPPQTASIYKAILPYALLIIFLVAGKFLLNNYSILIPFGINHNFSLYNPGFAFIITGLITTAVWHSKKHIGLTCFKTAAARSIEPFLVIFAMSAIVQLMINSGQNMSHLLSSITIIAKSFETSLLPLWSPFIGAFGSFLTGSVTISNIMFGNLWNDAAQALNFAPAKILSLGLVGGAIGNMIALSDMLVAETVVGLKNQEKKIIESLIGPCLIILLIIGIIGLII